MARLVAIAIWINVLFLCNSIETVVGNHRSREVLSAPFEDNYNNENDVDMPNDTLVVFDKSKSRNNDNDVPLSEGYEISQTFHGQDGMVMSLHDATRQQLYETVVPPSHRRFDPKLNNFNEHYQQWNETFFKKAGFENELEDIIHPYPPIVRASESNDDATERPLPPFAFQREEEIKESVTDQTYTYSTTTTTTEIPLTMTTTEEGLTTTTYSENTSGSRDYDNGVLAPGEEVNYADYGDITNNFDTSTRRTYSTLASIDDPTNTDGVIGVREENTEDMPPSDTEAPFDVTKPLMDALNHQTLQGPRRWSVKMAVKTTTPFGLQDSDATIHPTLVPKWDEDDEEVDEQTITSDYVTEMDDDHWNKVWPRTKLQPWERQRPENMEGSVKVSKENTDFENNHVQEDTKIKESTYLPPSFTKSILFPMSSIYQVPVPPLTSFVMVPAGQLYYGDQAASLHRNRDENVLRPVEPWKNVPSVPQSGDAGGAIPLGGVHAGGQKKIVRENTVTIEDVVEGSDLARSPQYEMFKSVSKNTANRAFGITNYRPAKPESANAESFLLSPVTIFDIALPSILKTAFAVNAKGYAARQYAAQTNTQTVLKMDESGSPLKYRRERPTSPPVAELSDIDVISGGSDDDSDVEAYVDENDASQEAVCDRRTLQRLRPDLAPGANFLKECFFAAEDCILVDTAPLERRINLNLVECATFCAENPHCKSISYSVVLSLCDIFGVLNGTHNTKLLQYKGYVYLQPIRPNLQTCLKTRQISAAPTNSMINRIDVRKVALPESTTQTTERSVNPGVRMNSCPPNNDVILFKSDHYRLRQLGLPHYSQKCAENECIFSCLIDLAEGRKPYTCAATNYNVDTGDCKLYSVGGNVKGNGHIVEDDGYTHYEKACAKKDFVDYCRGFPIDRFTQKTLIGFTITARTAASLLDCVTLCFQRFIDRGDCLSVTYFYSIKSHNCVLNSESHLTAAPYFVDEIEETADYASLDRCVTEIDESAEHEATESVNTKASQKTKDFNNLTKNNDISTFTMPHENNENAVIISGDSEIDPEADSFFNDKKRRSPVEKQNNLKQRLKQSIQRIRRL